MHTSTNEKLTFWKEKLQEYRESGLSRKAFSEQHGVKRSTLDYWFTRISKTQKAVGFVEVTPMRLPAVVTPSLQIVVAGRYRIEVHRGFDRQLLAEVLHSLEAL